MYSIFLNPKNVTKFIRNSKPLYYNNLANTPIRFNSTNFEKAPIITDEINKLGIFNDSPITDIFSDLMIGLHNFGSFEWSTTIMLSAFIFRLTVCLPIKVYQEILIARIINVKPKIEEALEKRFKDINIKSRFLTDEIKRKMKADSIRIRNSFYAKENCAPHKIPISSFLQMPFWIYMSASIRNLTAGFKGHSFQMEELRNESFAWLTSMASNDPSFILPAIYAIFALANLKYANLMKTSTDNRLSRIISFRKFLTLTFIGVLTVLIANLPASVGLFWISSNILSLFELILLDSLLVRRFFRIPSTNLDPKSIYWLKYNNLLNQLKNLAKKFTKK